MDAPKNRPAKIFAYVDGARLRAKRRKSAWNSLLIPLILIPWFSAWWYTIVVMAHAYRIVHHGAPTSFSFWDLRNIRLLPSEGIGSIFVAVGPFFAWLPVAMLFGNLLAYAVPSARRAFDREASPVPGTDYHSAQRGLLRFAAVLFPVGMFVSVLGLFL
jgi:hypothetical protein